MIESNVQDCFAELSELDLVTEKQRDAAQQHPALAKMQADAAESSRLLAWMLVWDIIPVGSLSAVLASCKNGMSVAACEKRRLVVQSAMEHLPRLRQTFNRDALKVLLHESIITEEQFARAEARLPNDEAFASPAAALMWMVLTDLLSPEEVSAIRSGAEADRAFPSAEKRVAIIAQADAMLNSVQEAAYSAVKKEFWDNVFPGPRWFWVIGFVAFFGYGIWAIFKPAMAPTCDDPDVQKTIHTMFFMANVEARSSVSYMLAGRSADSAVATPTLHGPHEAGYAKAQNARGCLATVKLGDLEEPYGYTIKPSRGEKGGYQIAGASAEMVQARYSHIDAEGKFGNRADPVGRTALEAAIRDGVNNFNSEVAARSSGFTRMREQMARQTSSTMSDPDRNREIADLEPDGNCREIVAGTRYACKVIMERNDPLLGVLGNGLNIVKADFTIERDGANAPWRVSGEFPKQYTEAIAGARIEALTGKAAATEATP